MKKTSKTEKCKNRKKNQPNTHCWFKTLCKNGIFEKKLF